MDSVSKLEKRVHCTESWQRLRVRGNESLNLVFFFFFFFFFFFLCLVCADSAEVLCVCLVFLSAWVACDGWHVQGGCFFFKQTEFFFFKQTEFNELGLQEWKPSSLNSFSSLTKRVHWTRFIRIKTYFNKLGLQEYKPSLLISFSSLTKRLLWTRFLAYQTHLGDNAK